jgi:hypothetical protein
MNFLKNIVILLLVLSTKQTVMAHGTPKLFSLDVESPENRLGKAENTVHVSIKRNFMTAEYKTVFSTELNGSSAYCKQPFARKEVKTSPDLITKLIRSNLKLSFRVSKTLNLTISYL